MEILNKLDGLKQNLLQGGESVDNIKSDVETYGAAKFEEGKLIGFDEGKLIGYEEGFAAGVASLPEVPVDPNLPVSDKIYSQIELDAALLDKSNEVKAAIKAKYDEAQAAESILEAAVFAEEQAPE